MAADGNSEELNAAQREAALFDLGSGSALPPGPPMLIVAGAGTGKTNTLAHRVAHLILRGADPERILLLTFTRRAAAAMASRPRESAPRDWATTVRSATGWPGRARSTLSAPSCSATMPTPSASTRASPSSIAPTRRTFSTSSATSLVSREPTADSQRRVPAATPSTPAGQRPGAAGRAPAHGLSLVRGVGRRAEAAVRNLCRGQATPGRARL